MRIARRVPFAGVDPVQDPVHAVGARQHQPFQPHAEFQAADLARIGRADGGDRVCKLHPGLEKPDPAVAFDSVHRPRCGRQAQLREDVGWVISLKRHVVDGDDARHSTPSLEGGKAQIGGHHPRLPVMCVDKVECAALHCTARNVSGGTGKGSKAAPVIVPVAPACIGVRPAFARKQRGRIEHQQRLSAQFSRQQPGRRAQQRVPAVHHLCLFTKLRQHRRIAGDEARQLYPLRRQRRWQRAGHIGKPAGLDERGGLRRHRKDAHRHAYSLRLYSFAIMSRVTSTTPLSDTRNRCASSTGSSPITMPSGMRTPESMMTLDSRAPRPMLQ